jgi:hypothetical protein
MNRLQILLSNSACAASPRADLLNFNNFNNVNRDRNPPNNVNHFDNQQLERAVQESLRTHLAEIERARGRV